MSNISGAGGQQIQWQVNPLHVDRPVQPQAPVVAPKDAKGSSGIMTGAELTAKMGGAPKSDITLFGKTLKTNSEAYKGTLQHLQTYQQGVAALDGDFKTVPQGEITKLKTELRQVIADATAYETKHAGSDSKAARRGVMAELKLMAQTELDNLDKLATLVNTDGKNVTVGDGLALLRGGVTDASAFTKDLNDSIVDKGRSKDSFASGKANAVSLLAYGPEMRVVKGISKEAEKLMAGESTTGFDQKDMRTAARNVASSNVAKELGIGKSIPMSDIVIHNGQAALAMKMAPGESLIHKFDVKITDQAQITKFDTELRNGWVDNLKNYGVRKDENGDWQKSTVGFKDIPYTGTDKPQLTANIQKGLLDLQLADCLMAQMDRQPENIFIQIKGDSAQITGIDNDMCMGKEMKKLDALDDGKPLRQDLKSTYGGPPPLMSREMFDKLKAMTPESLKLALGPEFTAEEKDSAVGRLALLKTHADGLEDKGFIVDDFSTWKGNDPKTGTEMNASDFLMASDLRSYVKRDATTLGKADQPLPLDVARH